MISSATPTTMSKTGAANQRAELRRRCWRKPRIVGAHHCSKRHARQEQAAGKGDARQHTVNEKLRRATRRVTLNLTTILFQVVRQIAHIENDRRIKVGEAHHQKRRKPAKRKCWSGENKF